MNDPIHIIGAGLAGSEAAWQAAELGAKVILHEMRPQKETPAHKTSLCAELVCSNSFRSDDSEHNAVGLLHEEMRRCRSLIMKEGDKACVPAGGALAVDRDIFSQGVSDVLEAHPNIEIVRQEIDALPPKEWKHVIIATGPLTSDPLAMAIKDLTGEDSLAFFDAIAPIVQKDSIDFEKAWFQSRYDKEGPAGTGKDYINCPLNKEQYETFIKELLEADYGEFKEWEKDTPYFEGCMPIEVMASRGIDTLRFGPMKPVGLYNPHLEERPHAVLQLRQDNALGTLYNLVGFQTKMKYGEQIRVFKTIPGLENADFVRLGGLHRNTFINSPRLLDHTLALHKDKRIRFAGQITGCEGYVESAAIGILAARFTVQELKGQAYAHPPQTTALGALLNHITGGAESDNFQPMNVNFGLFPSPTKEEEKLYIESVLEKDNKENKDNTEQTHQKSKKRKKLKGKDRKKLYTSRALSDLDRWIEEHKFAA